MITLLILIAWLLPALAVYRRVGFALESKVANGHDARGICGACRCTNCNEKWGDHRYGGACGNYAQRIGGIPHARTAIALPAVLLLWPGVLFAYGIILTKARLGLEAPSFFVPPPVVETKQEKSARLLAEREKAAQEREAAIDAEERRLGIGPYREGYDSDESIRLVSGRSTRRLQARISSIRNR